MVAKTFSGIRFAVKTKPLAGDAGVLRGILWFYSTMQICKKHIYYLIYETIMNGKKRRSLVSTVRPQFQDTRNKL